MSNMRTRRFIQILAVMVSCCVCAPAAHAQECYNAAYRYCCDLTAEFHIDCAGEPGGCYGEVANGQNGFHTVLVSGGYTANSFEVDSVAFSCHFYRPVCNPLIDPSCSVDYTEVVPRNCVAWKMKQQFTLCEDH